MEKGKKKEEGRRLILMFYVSDDWDKSGKSVKCSNFPLKLPQNGRKRRKEGRRKEREFRKIQRAPLTLLSLPHFLQYAHWLYRKVTIWQGMRGRKNERKEVETRLWTMAIKSLRKIYETSWPLAPHTLCIYVYACSFLFLHYMLRTIRKTEERKREN